LLYFISYYCWRDYKKALFISITIGILKEIMDLENGDFSIGDLEFDFLGVLFGLIYYR